MGSHQIPPFRGPGEHTVSRRGSRMRHDRSALVAKAQRCLSGRPRPATLPNSRISQSGISRTPVRVRYCPRRRQIMCRNIRTLFNFDPPATDAEIHAAALQFVRKISGYAKPSAANEAAFATAVDDIARISARLLASLETTASPKNREDEAVKARARSVQRFAN